MAEKFLNPYKAQLVCTKNIQLLPKFLRMCKCNDSCCVSELQED